MTLDDQFMFAKVILHTKRDFEPSKIAAAEKTLKVVTSFLSASRNDQKNRRNLRVD